MMHHPDCDVNDQNADGIAKPCNCQERGASCAAPAGSVTLTYAELEALLHNCRWGIESAPGEDPPDGYEALPPEQAEIADACWHRGMEQLSTALLNYWYDHGAGPVSPNAPGEPPARENQKL